MALVTLFAVSLQLNGMLMMWKLHQAKQDYANRGALLWRIHYAFILVTGLNYSYGKIFHPTYQGLGWQDRASPPSHTHPKFYKGFRGQTRPCKPGQPGLLGACEEALMQLKVTLGNQPAILQRFKSPNCNLRWVQPTPGLRGF